MTCCFDTNVLVYAFFRTEKREIAVRALAGGGIISAQVLGEFTNVARNQHRRSWPDVEMALAVIRAHFPQIVPITADRHAEAVALARDHGFAFYDALIVAAALEAGCDTLFSEDMQDGRSIGALTIVNPFTGTLWSTPGPGDRGRPTLRKAGPQAVAFPAAAHHVTLRGRQFGGRFRSHEQIHQRAGRARA